MTAAFLLATPNEIGEARFAWVQPVSTASQKRFSPANELDEHGNDHSTAGLTESGAVGVFADQIAVG